MAWHVLEEMVLTCLDARTPIYERRGNRWMAFLLATIAATMITLP